MTEPQKTIILKLDASLHYQLRLRALNTGQTMAAVLRRYIAEGLVRDIPPPMAVRAGIFDVLDEA